MPGPWTWDQSTHRYRSTASGRFMGAEEMLGLRDKFVEAQREQARAIAQRLIDGQTDTATWLREHREMIKQSYIDQYVMARGGRSQMTQADWGRVGQMVRDQYKYAQGFAEDIKAKADAGEPMSEAQILARAQMYPQASTEAYEKGHAAALGVPILKQYPGDGQTSCLCITTPDSRVLTMHGWVPMRSVPIGAMVMTHKGRWRPVTHRIVKRSQPEHRQVWVRAPSGGWVGATDTHLWLTQDGWHNANDICNSSCSEYPLAITCKGGYDGYPILRAVREATVESKQAGAMPAVSVDMRVRPAEGHARDEMQSMRLGAFCGAGACPMAESDDTGEDAIGHRCGAGPTAHDIRCPGMGDGLARQSRWADVDMDLGGGAEARDLPIPVGVAESAWPYPGWDGGPSSQQGYDRRPARELGAFAVTGAQGDTCTRSGESLSDADVRSMRGGVQALCKVGPCPNQVLLAEMLSRGAEGQSGEHYVPGVWKKSGSLSIRQEEAASEILLAGMLPQGTALWDLAVAEDHSFIIEGLVSHNSNCLCHLEYERTETGWDVYWKLGATDFHCETQGDQKGCVDMASAWNPLHVRGSSKAVKFPGQSRDDMGRFGEGGGGAQKPSGPPTAIAPDALANESGRTFDELEKAYGGDPNAGARTEAINKYLTGDVADAYTAEGGAKIVEMKKDACANLSDNAGLSEQESFDAIKTWANTSNDTCATSLTLQKAAAELEGRDLPEYQTGQLQRCQKAGVDPKISDAQAKSAINAMYAKTQADLAAQGFKPDDLVKVARGATMTGTRFANGEVVSLENPSPLESWSFSRVIANGFAGDVDSSKLSGYVRKQSITMEAYVPVRNILCGPRTGFGCASEQEVVVLGTPRQARISRAKSGWGWKDPPKGDPFP